MLRVFKVTLVGSLLVLLLPVASSARREEAVTNRRTAMHLARWCALQVSKTGQCPTDLPKSEFVDGFFVSDYPRASWRFACNREACVSYSQGPDHRSDLDDVAYVSDFSELKDTLLDGSGP